MSRRKLTAGLLGLAVAALVAFWPPHRVDVSPVFQRHGRPPHPISIYYPPGEPQPKVPGDPGWVRS